MYPNILSQTWYFSQYNITHTILQENCQGLFNSLRLTFCLYVREIDTTFYLYIGIPLALLIHIGWKLIQQMSDIYFSWTEYMVMFKLRFGLNGCAMIWSGPSYCGLDTRCRHLTPNFYLSCLCLSQINSV